MRLTKEAKLFLARYRRFRDGVDRVAQRQFERTFRRPGAYEVERVVGARDPERRQGS
jgi:hypothetical protein